MRTFTAGLLAWGGLALLPPAATAAPTAVVASGSGLTAPTGIAETPDGSLWVSDEILGICRLSGEQDRAPVPGSFCGAAHAGPVKAAGLVFDPITRSFYAGDASSHGGAVWRLRWDAGTQTIEGALPIARIPGDRVTAVGLLPAAAVAAAPDVLYATKESTAIMRLPVTGSSTLPAAPRAVGHAAQPGPSSVAPLGARVYIADGADVSWIDVTSGGPAQRIPGLAGGMATALTVDAARGRVYAGTANGLDDRVNVFEPSTGVLTSYDRGFAGVTALAVDGTGALLVADDPAVGMGVLDAAGQGRLWRVPLRAVTRPSVRVTAAPRGVSSATRATFAFSSSAGSVFECRLDDSAWSPCGDLGSGESTYADLSDGRHEFAVRATHPDPAVGTGEATSRVFVVDTRAPRAWIAAPAHGETVLGRPVTVDLLADEPGVDFSCSLDGAPFEFCDSRAVLEDLTAGDHELRIRGIDAAGNVSGPDAPEASWAFRTLATVVTVEPADPRPTPSVPVSAATGAAPPAPASPGLAANTVGRAAPSPRIDDLRLAPASKSRAGRPRLVGIRTTLRAPAGVRKLVVSIKSGSRELGERRFTARPGANDIVVRLTRRDARRLAGSVVAVTVTPVDGTGRPGLAARQRLRLP